MNERPYHRPMPFLMFTVAFLVFAVTIFVFFDLFYPPRSFTNANTMSPLMTRLFLTGLMFVIALIPGAIWLNIRNGLRKAQDTPLTKSRQELASALQQALGFTAEDLQANQRGEFSTSQQAVIYELTQQSQSAADGCQMVFWLIPIGLVLLAFSATFLFMGPAMRAVVTSPGPLAVLVLVVIGVLVLILVMRRAQSPVMASVKDLQLRHEEGIVQLRAIKEPGASSYSRGGHIKYIVNVNGHSMWLTDSLDASRSAQMQFEGFWSGASYRIYYVQVGYVVLLFSAELLSTPTNRPS